MRVLLLSKDREFGRQRASALQSAGHRVIFPADKAEAVREIKRGAYEVAVISYTLSNDTALELHELIRQSSPSCGIVILTNHAWADNRLEHDVAITGDEGAKTLVAAVNRARIHQPSPTQRRR